MIKIEMSLPEPKFKVGEIVVVGGTKRRHIYAKPQWGVWGEYPDKPYVGYLYPVDYGLGGCSEGFVLENRMQRSTRLDRNKPL